MLLLAAALLAATLADSVPRPADHPPLTVSVPAGATPVRQVPPTATAPARMTLPPQEAARDDTRGAIVEYGDWYARRLTIHRWTSIAMVPLFVAQYASGRQVLEHGRDAPTWARRAHQPLAGAIAGTFGLNILTGGWNMWEGRNDPAERGRRWVHTALMLGASAGFVATAALAEDDIGEGEEGEDDEGDDFQAHQTAAIAATSVAVIGAVIMLPPFRRD